MIRIIKGKFHIGFKDSIIIETDGGIGYEVYVPSNSEVYHQLEGTDIKLFTSMVVRENEISLYGFSEKENLSIFETLLTVNGVGAKAAMAIMSAIKPTELRFAIGNGDTKLITTANGVGKKIAERIVLELKDKIGITTAMDSEEQSAVIITDEKNEAITALVALGYSRNEATAAIGKVKENNLTCQQYIKSALRELF